METTGSRGWVTARAGCLWLLSVSFQLPVMLFFLTDAAILILPMERALTLLFHLRQIGEVESPRPRHHQLHPLGPLPPHHRSVLPMTGDPRRR
ncbi:unnamed protein product [Arctogadus glacialis]